MKRAFTPKLVIIKFHDRLACLNTIYLQLKAVSLLLKLTNKPRLLFIPKPLSRSLLSYQPVMCSTTPTKILLDFLTTHPAAHFATTPKGELVWQNEAFAPLLEALFDLPKAKATPTFFSVLLEDNANTNFKHFILNNHTSESASSSISITHKAQNYSFELQFLQELTTDENETLYLFNLRYNTPEILLQHYQKRYKEVVETQHELICRAKLDTSLTFVNEAYCRYFGKSEDELLGHPFLEFIPEEERKNALASFQRILTPPHVVEYEYAITDSKGQTRWHRWTDRLVENHKGEPEVQSVGLDITDLKEVQLRLAESEARLHYAIENTRLVIWDWNILTGEVLSNDEWYRMLGYMRSELPGTTEAWVSTIHPEDQKEALQKTQEHLSGKSPNYQIEKRLKHKDGHWIWVLSSGKVVEFTPTGEPARMVGTILDITERKATEERLWESEYRYRTVVETISKGIVLQNINGQIETCNPAAKQILGLTRAQMEGKTSIDPLWRCIHQDGSPFPGEEHPAMVSLRTGKPVRGVTMGVYKPDGSLTWILVKSTPLFHTNKTEPYAVVALFNDITEAIKNEEALRVAVLEAKKASRAKSTFLANMSHEIRTPLNGIIGFNDLLMQNQSSFSREQREYLQAIQQSSNALMGIINDILDFSKIEAGKLELNLEHLDLHKIVREVIMPLSFQAKRKNLMLRTHYPKNAPFFVQGDDTRLRQILLNLLSNAVKFTQAGEVKLEVQFLGYKNKEEVNLRFLVSDTGIGIAPENQKRIFGAFTQEDSSTTKLFGGTGLGLSISNSLLHLMGSELQLTSVLGKGSTFFFDLSMEISAEETVEGKDLSALSPVLIVDDQKENCELLLEMLEKVGIEADTVSQGIEAIHQLEKRKYKVILMDYHMPYMNGLNTAQYIHEKLGNSAPSILLLSSSSEEEEIDFTKSQRYIRERLQKPIQRNLLYKRLAQLSQTHHSNTPLSAEKKINKVLIVDDHHVNTLLSQRILQNILPHAQLKIAENGQQAVSTFKTFVPDLILMDVQMPIMNGYDATRAIRQLPSGQGVLIFALTAGTLKGEAQKCINAGMNDYLSKPITQDKLLGKIKKWLNATADKPKEKQENSENKALLPNLSNLRSFNIEKLKLLLDNEEDLIFYLIAEASHVLDKAPQELNHYFEKQQENELFLSLHKLRGVAMNLYFEKLAQLIQTFKTTPPEDEARPALFSAIQKEIKIVLRKVQELST